MPLFLARDPLTGVTVPLSALRKGGELLDRYRRIADRRPILLAVPSEPVPLVPHRPLGDDE